MCPFLDDVQELDVFPGLLLQSVSCLPTIVAAIRLFFAEKALQVTLANQKVYLMQPEYAIGRTL